MSKNFIYISKLDVAKRELEHATRLFFSYGDFTVIHLVISASKSILYDLAKEQSIITFKDEMKKLFKPEKWEYLQRILKKPYNYFKHADHDPNKLLKFNPETSEFEIWEAINVYQSLTHEITGLMLAFRAWFYIKHKDILLEPEQKEIFTDIANLIDLNDKSQFLIVADNYENKRVNGTFSNNPQ